jgi:hypothetical protein
MNQETAVVFLFWTTPSIAARHSPGITCGFIPSFSLSVGINWRLSANQRNRFSPKQNNFFWREKKSSLLPYRIAPSTWKMHTWSLRPGKYTPLPRAPSPESSWRITGRKPLHPPWLSKLRY